MQLFHNFFVNFECLTALYLRLQHLTGTLATRRLSIFSFLCYLPEYLIIEPKAGRTRTPLPRWPCRRIEEIHTEVAFAKF